MGSSQSLTLQVLKSGKIVNFFDISIFSCLEQLTHTTFDFVYIKDLTNIFTKLFVDKVWYVWQFWTISTFLTTLIFVEN